MKCASCPGKAFRLIDGRGTCRDCLKAWPLKLTDARSEWARIERTTR